MWADAQRDGRPAEYRWHLLLNAGVGLTPTTRMPCTSAANIGQRKTWTESEFCTSWNPLRGNSPWKCLYSAPALETAKHRAKFGWPPLSDVGAVMKPRPETHWNLLGCPTLVNRSQPLMGRSSPYRENMWRRYCCLTSSFTIVITCLRYEDTGRARQSCAMVSRWRIFGDILRPVLSASRV